MAKNGNDFYVQLTRHIFTDGYKHLSNNAKWLYVVLNELEHKFTNKDTDFFYRSNKDLETDAGMSDKTLKRAKAELIKTDLIQTWKAHFVYNKGTPDEKKSKKHITCYKVRK